MHWSNDELREALKRYEHECEAAGLQPTTVDSYVRYAQMFLRWRVVAFRPRDAVGPAHQPTHAAATTDDLRTDHQAYEGELRAAKLQPKALHTYLVGSAQFIRWLDGEFLPGSRLAGRRGGGVVPGPDRGRPEPVDLSWAREAAVQAAVVAWLRTEGWAIDRQADTESRQHGVDIVASRGTERLGVEVKGYPQSTYSRGVNAGQPRKWHPAAQARTYFGNALHTALVMRDASPASEVAVAVADMPGNRALAEQVHRSLGDLGIRLLLVQPDGSVLEPYSATVQLPSASGTRRLR